jgi:hypothetical protein
LREDAGTKRRRDEGTKERGDMIFCNKMAEIYHIIITLNQRGEE